MMEFLTSLSAWHWFVLGGLLLIAEAVGAGGFLLGMFVAALVTGIATYLGLSWQWQFIVFAVLSVLFSAYYWHRFRKFNQRTDRPGLNDRTASQVGRYGVVVVDEVSGSVKAKLGDTLWAMDCEEPCENGDRIQVVAVEGNRLQVKKI